MACSNYPECAYKRNLSENSEIIETDIVCDKCGHKMVERTGKYGKFLACSNYPKCKNILPINKKVATCPLCGKDIVEKRNKKGEIFYGCSGYPNCSMIFKDKPTDKLCPKCNNVLLGKESKTSTKLYCSNPHCDYQEFVERKEEQN